MLKNHKKEPPHDRMYLRRVAHYLKKRGKPPEQIVLDVDAADDPAR